MGPNRKKNIFRKLLFTRIVVKVLLLCLEGTRNAKGTRNNAANSEQTDEQEETICDSIKVCLRNFKDNLEGKPSLLQKLSDGDAVCKDSFESFSAIAQRKLCAFSEEASQQEPYIPVQVAMGCTELECKSWKSNDRDKTRIIVFKPGNRSFLYSSIT